LVQLLGKNDMAPRQTEVYRFIVAFRTRRGVSPTIREIGEGVGITSPNGVIHVLRALRRQGVLTWEQNRARTVRPVVPDGADWGEHAALVQGIGDYLRRGA
jgi:SOS-response transcriptional repressor LexA